MKGFESQDPRDKFKFLDEKTSNEPHVYEVLNEILLYQTNSLPSGEKLLATMDLLKKSSKIKIPFTTTRDRTIEYLVDILLKRYGHFIRPVISFEFKVEQTTRQIDIVETTEYTILLDNKDFETLLSLRDEKSLDNLLDILQKYRFFNLSKLMKKADEKEELSRIIKKELDKKIFTFKNYSIDSDKIEWAEDFCFHIENYEPVKESLNLNTLKEIIATYSDSVRRGLNKFGILNSDFSDYRDTKLAYIFNVLTDDLSTTISDKDMVDIKNLQSLISCLNRVDKVIDPVLVISEDIVKFIREHKISRESDIIGSLPELNHDIIRKWAKQDILKTNKIVAHTSGEGEIYYIDGSIFFELISDLNQLVLYQPEKMREMSQTERRRVNFQMDLLYGASMHLFKSSEKIDDYIKINNEKLQILKKILDDYEKYKRKQISGENAPKEQSSAPKLKKERNIFTAIIKGVFRFFVSLFKFYAKGESNDSGSVQDMASLQRKNISSEAIKVYKKAVNINAPVIPLSDFIELIPENDYLVNRIIEDMRENNLKIIIPIYNARKNLYPRRSQKLLLSDVEYLLVSPDLVKAPEIIRGFTDSIVGLKIKDEVIPASAIIAIEKYLLTLYRQKRASK
jgi:hypothetical protein